jgi:hypothetical protein
MELPKKQLLGFLLAILLISMLIFAINIPRVKTKPAIVVIPYTYAMQEAINNADLPWGNWSHYHNYTEIVDTLLYLNDSYPNIVDVFLIGQSWQNRDIYCIRLTNESNTNPKPQVFFVGYHHAREPITAELTLYFTVYAATNFGTNMTITQMLNSSEIYIVPALNVDGFDLFKVNDWQRKNARPTNEDGDGLVDEDPPEDENQNGFVEELWNLITGDHIRWEGIDNDGDGQYGEDWIGGVDLNRNYGYQWQGGSSDPNSEIYKGPAPFSEPETQAIRNLVLSHNFTYAISFHSGAELILYPWDYSYTPPPDEAKFIEIAQGLSNITGGTTYEQSSDLYISYGAWDDWMYGTKNVFALTCEIFTNDTFEGVVRPGPYPNTIWEGGIRYWFNPFPNGIETVIQRWLPVFFNITNRAIADSSPYDVAITGIAAHKVVGQGFTTMINVTVANQGFFAETFNVTLYANAISLASQTVILASKAYQIITFAWNTTGYSKGNYTIKAVADSVEGEVDTADNLLIDGQIHIAKVCDLGGRNPPQFYECDEKIDGKDLSLFLLCLKRTAPPEAMYLGDVGSGIPLQFFKCDGKVNGQDLALFLLCYKGLGPDPP